MESLIRVGEDRADTVSASGGLEFNLIDGTVRSCYVTAGTISVRFAHWGEVQVWTVRATLDFGNWLWEPAR